MQPQAQAIVLDNLRTQVARRWTELVASAQRLQTTRHDLDLRQFLIEAGVELADVLRAGTRSWTRLRRDAGLPTAAPGPSEADVLKRVRAFAHVDDPVRATAYRRLLSDDAPTYQQLEVGDRRLAHMLVASVWPNQPADAPRGLSTLQAEPAVRDEIRQVVALAFDRSRQVTTGLADELDGAAADLPLRLHASYSREEALLALDFPRAPATMREGVVYLPDLDVDALFVTLKKSEADYSPSTMYRDYPISSTLFHWESQSRTTVDSPTGRRYLGGSSTVLLFARLQSRGEYGTSPYLLLGPAQHVSHQGERPIAITWRLRHPVPAEFLVAASAIAS